MDFQLCCVCQEGIASFKTCQDCGCAAHEGCFIDAVEIKFAHIKFIKLCHVCFQKRNEKKKKAREEKRI